MSKGAGGTQAQTQAQPEQVVFQSINGAPVKSAKELQEALDKLAPGTGVKIAYKSAGKDRVIEGVVK